MVKDIISKKAEKAFEKIQDKMSWDRMETILKKHKTRLQDEIKKGSSVKKAAGLEGGGSVRLAKKGGGRAYGKNSY